MGFFAFLGILVFLYYLISVILWCVLDSDIELWFKERWGKQRGESESLFLFFFYRNINEI